MQITQKFSHFKAHFKIKGRSPVQLPEYPGATFKGALGHALRGVRFGMKPGCRECGVQTDCRNSRLYDYLFETPGDHPFVQPDGADNMQNKDHYPQPFVLNPPEGGEYLPGDVMTLRFTLIGKAVSFLPFFICGLENISRNPVGKYSGRIRLLAVTNGMTDTEDSKDLIYDARKGEFVRQWEITGFSNICQWVEQQPQLSGKMQDLRTCFLTPFRFKNNNRLDDELTFEIFMRNVFRRLHLLSVHSQETDDYPYRELLEKAEHIRIKKKTLKWADWKRYSNREKTEMMAGGIVGEIIFSGPLREFMPYIKMCEFLNIGKACTFGLGNYATELLEES